ncbi:MAG: universal stress protein [Kibdelosporangium sp.]
MTATTTTTFAAPTPRVAVSAEFPPERHRTRITIGTDGSAWGDAALDWALRHAWLMNAGLQVYTPESGDDRAIARRLDVYRWLHASVRTSADSPLQTLLSASADTDLLVLGHHGHTQRPLGIGHLVLPVVTASQSDTVVVRGESRAVRAEHGWVTAAIGGRHDDVVIRRAAEIAVRYRNSLRLVHAWPLPGSRSLPMPEPAELVGRARQLVSRVAPTLNPSVQVVRTSPHEAVETCVRSDLLVLGPGSEPGGLSPITRTALHLAPCPVLVVR